MAEGVTASAWSSQIRYRRGAFPEHRCIGASHGYTAALLDEDCFFNGLTFSRFGLFEI
jgi:hypothetical protein